MMFARKLLWVLGCAFVSATAATLDAPEFTAQARELTRQFGGELKGALSAALTNSPEHAIAVCNEQAPQIASRLGRAQDLAIGRTALRVRNPANAPAAWQRTVLEQFAARRAAGEALATMEYSAQAAVTGEDGAAYIEHRYMKAIGTEPLCLVCHGAELAPGVRDAIRERYPEDAATGFQVGDLRGAFYVVRRALDVSSHQGVAIVID